MRRLNLPDTGRVFYGIAIAALGLLTIFYHDFPYMLIPAKHSGIPGLSVLAYVSGAFLLFAGACIVFEKMKAIILLLGSVFLLVFCFYFIPYQFLSTSNYLQLGAWENAEKELALCGGAFIIAGSYARFSIKLFSLGVILFAVAILSFGVDHFLYTNGVSEYIPSWISNRLFWTYFAGTALIGSGIALLLKIKTRLAAILLGSMIFTWFIILHLPKVVASHFADQGGEAASALLALAYSGTAFVIARGTKSKK